MSTVASEGFLALLDTRYQGGLDERDKGSKFERLIRAYLTTDPLYASEFSHVWLWNEYPWRQSRADTGIDLVAQSAATGELTAIQCKFLDPQRPVAKPEIDSFMAASSRAEFSYRMLVSTSSKGLGPNAQATVEGAEPAVSVLNVHDLASADIEWQQFSFQGRCTTFFSQSAAVTPAIWTSFPLPRTWSGLCTPWSAEDTLNSSTRGQAAGWNTA